MKTRILIALFVMVLGVLVCCAQTVPPAPSVTLAWDVTPDTGVIGYNVYWGVQSRSYTNHVFVTPRQTNTVVIANLARGTKYFFAATCTNSVGLESALSSEVTYDTMPLPPQVSGLTVTTKNP